jgi:hypothetical protein
VLFRSDRVLKVTTKYNSDGTSAVEYDVIGKNGKFTGTDSSENQEYNYGIDGNDNTIINGKGLPKTINIGGSQVSNVERGSAIRYGNVS